MTVVRTFIVIAVAAAAGHAASAPPPPKQTVTGPEAVYWMSAATTSGMGGMSGMQGGPNARRPGLGSMMSMGQAQNPNTANQSLTLQLGTSRRASGPPAAEHDPPASLGAGVALPLLTPQARPVQEDREPGPPPQFQQPKGRMLIFWGCGEHAGPGQPLVLDFSKIGPSGQGAAQFAALSRGLGVTPMQPPSPSRNTTYGEWPNERSRSQVPPDGSLQGAHTIKGNYTPDINFTLAADQDFLPPFRLTSNVTNPTGSAGLGWRNVDGARGYFATMFGARGENEMVMWTSSQAQASAFALPDYLSDGEISPLVASHVLMAPSQTSCIVPQEAVKAAGTGFFNLVAYGGETNISYPPRPPAPKPWNIAWTVKVRYRSATSGLLGMTMPQMGDYGDRPQQGQPPKQKPRFPNVFNPLGG